MLQEHLIHLSRRNLFPPTVDDLLDAASDEKVTLCIHVTYIACPKPTTGERSSIRRRVVFIASHDVSTTDNDFACLVAW